ncbi:hypothetical protein B5F14_01060 [Faecalitalea cylindroides]|uniref:Uncharacterized protein n=1 Tax=Faecalitalea cylindroides TaxID=39483 RepID=A0A1Y4LZI4_9FIRM|nr:hypothetical protein [Faecalitalea cylindroides]OUP62005.1 hypothetical protein B5F14_01060 [Faecalitalea cylindroides]
MNKKRNIKPGTGIATILLIFVVLAMTIMAALSYVRTWQDDQSLQREYEYRQAYYKADAKAKYICDEIMQLKDVEEISTQNQVDIQFEKNIYSFQIEIRSNQVLEVQMDQDGNILEWMTKTKEEM